MLWMLSVSMDTLTSNWCETFLGYTLIVLGQLRWTKLMAKSSVQFKFQYAKFKTA